MNLLTIAELKRRGMAAIEESLNYGPVHILKHNKPAAVVITEQEYQALLRNKAAPLSKNDSLQWLINYVPHGLHAKTALDDRLAQERDAWDAQ